MKANELMIGDWVAFRGHPYQYTGQDIATMEECENRDALTDTTEIPLTAEILKKNGFTKCNVDDDGAVQYEFGFDDIGIDVWIARPCLLGAWRRWPDLKKPYSMINELPIRYVHELQHAIRLIGMDKQIRL